MLKNPNYYEFNEFRFYPQSLQLESTKTGLKVNLSPIHAKFLLTLVKRFNSLTSYDDFNDEVWVYFKSDDKETLLHTIQSTKSSLMNELKQLGVKTNLITAIPRKGYILNASVKLIEGNTEIQNSVGKPRKFAFGQDTAYILGISGIYGSLFGLALILEIAYQFDRFRYKSIILAALTLLFVATSTIFTFYFVKSQIKTGKKNSLIVGAFIIILSAVLVCLSLASFLPTEPITAASFQTQTAFGAYIKNIFFYFVPPFIVFSLIPFHFVMTLKKEIAIGNAQDVVALLSNDSKQASPFGAIYFHPLWLSCLLVVFAILSLYSGFSLFDNLQVNEYHNLFISLLIARNLCVFGICSYSLIWYETSINSIKRNQASEIVYTSQENWVFNFFKTDKNKMGLMALLTIILISIHLVGKSSSLKPHLDSLEFVTPATTGKQFFINLKGLGFIPQKISLVIVGEGCPVASPCRVPNGALKKHGTQDETSLLNIPLSLQTGKYQLFAQNADSPFSNEIEILVND